MGNSMKVVIGIIAIAISFAVFPIVLDGVQVILTDANIADYTGLEAMAAIAPMLIFISMLVTGGLLSFQGIRGATGKKGK